MRYLLPVFITILFVIPAQAKIPVLSGKQYKTAKSAAAGGGSYNITRTLGGRKIIKDFGVVRARAVKTTASGQGNRFAIETRKMNPDMCISNTGGVSDSVDGAYIVIVGNIVDGVSFYGPFVDVEDASRWIESNHHDAWEIAGINIPHDTELTENYLKIFA